MRKRWNKTRNSFCCASHSRSSVTACQIVAVGTVPQSVPLGTPRNPLQGLAVPQFHHFRRIDEIMRKHRREIRLVFPFPVCQRANTVNVSSVPQSVPPGTPRKPIQGLAVPQFHDFRRRGEKNTENRSSHIPEKRAHAHSPHKPRVRLDRSGRVRIRKRGRSRPERLRRASWRVRGGGGSTENEGAVRRRKNTGFSPRFRLNIAGFIVKQE